MTYLLYLALLGATAPTHRPVYLSGFSGCTETSINVSTECEITVTNVLMEKKKVSVEDYHTMALYIFYDRGGGTGYQFHLDVCIEGYAATDCTDSTDWYNIMAQSASGQTTSLAQKTYSRSVSVDDYAVMFVGVVYPRLRVHGIQATGGGATAADKITIKVGLHQEAISLIP